ncbi:MAG: hypothetical protein P2A85_20595 [Microcoleus anatoxicus]|uniref:hypothetical protein n=1 Tax=Microcoleus anatoxicus TaxID=2705319 RepID=UPI003673441E
MPIAHRAIAMLLSAVKIAIAREFGLLSPTYAQPLIYQEKCQQFPLCHFPERIDGGDRSGSITL